jgi:integrase
VQGRIEAVLDWATVQKYRKGENPARWRGHLDKLLPSRSKVRKVEHHPALPYGELPGFLEALRDREGIGHRALEFSILTVARSGETLGARWPEVDLAEKVWIVPADRMKGGTDRDGGTCVRSIDPVRTSEYLSSHSKLWPCLMLAPDGTF